MEHCQHCRPCGDPATVCGRCRFCGLALCAAHLGAALRPDPLGRRRGDCGHLFVASGWLAEALDRQPPAVPVAESR